LIIQRTDSFTLLVKVNYRTSSTEINRPFPQATVEIEKVGEAIRKRLADEGFLTTERSTVEPRLRLVLEPAPGELMKGPKSLVDRTELAPSRKRP
jgi:hypothetical protein